MTDTNPDPNPDFIPRRRAQPIIPVRTHQNIYNQVMLDWIIPKSDQYKLSHHYLLHWNPTYLFSTWGTYKPIIREGITYLVIYHNCHPAELKAAKVVLLSFRKLPDMPTGYVLISPARTASQQTLIDHKSQLPKDRS